MNVSLMSVYSAVIFNSKLDYYDRKWNVKKGKPIALRNEIADLKGKQQKISEDFSSKKAFLLRWNGNYNKTMIEIRIIVT